MNMQAMLKQAQALQMQNDTAYANAQAKQKASDANMMKARASAIQGIMQQMQQPEEQETEKPTEK